MRNTFLFLLLLLTSSLFHPAPSSALDVSLAERTAAVDDAVRPIFMELLASPANADHMAALFMGAGVLRDPALVDFLKEKRKTAPAPERAAMNYFIVKAMHGGPDPDAEAAAFLESLPDLDWAEAYALYAAETKMSKHGWISSFITENYLRKARFSALALRKLIIHREFYYTYHALQENNPTPAEREHLERHPEFAEQLARFLDQFQYFWWDIRHPYWHGAPAAGRQAALPPDREIMSAAGARQKLWPLLAHENRDVRLAACRILGLFDYADEDIVEAARRQVSESTDVHELIILCGQVQTHGRKEALPPECAEEFPEILPETRREWQALLETEAVLFGGDRPVTEALEPLMRSRRLTD